MFIGETFAGKSSIIGALSDDNYTPRRIMAVDYHGQFINTPGEFLENRRFYNALITSSADCTILAFVQDATRSSSVFPPLFASLFNRRVIGIISKIDATGINIDRAERFLHNSGIKEIVCTSCKTGEGLDLLRQMLK